MDPTADLFASSTFALPQDACDALETLQRIESLTDTLCDGEIRRVSWFSGRLDEPRLLRSITTCMELQNDPVQICREILSQLSGCIPCQSMMIQLDGSGGENSVGILEETGESLTSEQWAAVAFQAKANHDVYAISVPILHRSSSLGRLVATRDRSMVPFDTEETEWIQSVTSVLAMHLVNQRQFVEMQGMLQGTVRSLVAALEAKDSYTNGHSSRVATLATALAERLGMNSEAIERLKLAGVLHDIGKIGIDDSVLKKPGALTAQEFEQVKRHPVVGYEILKDILPFRQILPAVRHHHESWDGTGYPDGLVGNVIPRDAQILAVADAFDAMISDRPYRRGLPLAKVREIFQNGRGQQWASDVVDVLLGSEDLLQHFSTNGTFTEFRQLTNGEPSDSSPSTAVPNRC